MSVRQIWIRRAYDEPGDVDGYRVLVDRVWPRGVSKDAIEIDAWCKDVAPSTKLRQWFAHDEERFDAFADRYRRELDDTRAADALLEQVPRDRRRITLVYGARNEHANQAVVLRTYLRECLNRASD